jgi:hypothetical protein
MSNKKTVKTKASKAKTKAPTADTLGRLIDRHGDDCGYLLYAPYFSDFSDDTILCLSDDAPRTITLETWERWGKQAKSFHKSVESALAAEWTVKKVVKKKAKKVSKKAAKK